MKVIKEFWPLALIATVLLLTMISGCASTGYMGDTKPVTRTECEIQWRLDNPTTYEGYLPVECKDLPETLW